MNIETIKKRLSEEGFLGASDRIEKLSGDASSREYFRLHKKDESLIVCVEEPHGQQSKDFNTITSQIETVLRTPKILYYNPNDSIIILEDVGSQSLKDYCDTNGLKQHLKAVDDIHIYQQLPKDVCQNRYFDEEKISFEFDLAVKYFLNTYGNVELSDSEKSVVDSVRKIIIDYYESHKEVVCHRDYHSNNIYVKEDVLFHIDYQDMRIGPRMYDLVSLVDDCYIQFSDKDKKLLVEQYDDDFYTKYLSDYHIVQVQRTFKALGSFAYLNIEKSKSNYLVHIPVNIQKLINICEDSSISEFRSFSKVLKRVVL